MRKKTIKNCADTIFWYALYFLPILTYLIYMLAEPSTGTNIINLNDFMTQTGLITTQNLIFTTLTEIFGTNGVMELVANNGILMFFSWFVSMYIIHLVIDMLLFIPRIAHKWLKGVTDND